MNEVFFLKLFSDFDHFYNPRASQQNSIAYSSLAKPWKLCQNKACTSESIFTKFYYAYFKCPFIKLLNYRYVESFIMFGILCDKTLSTAKLYTHMVAYILWPRSAPFGYQVRSKFGNCENGRKVLSADKMCYFQANKSVFMKLASESFF